MDGALERLSKISGSAKAWNDLGVGYALKGDFPEAKSYFERTAGSGDNAKHNLEELAKTTNR